MSASKPYAITPRAEADLEAIWLFSASNWSIAQAERYHRKITAVIEDIAGGAKRGRPQGDVRPGYRACHVGSHTVYYRERNDRIEIIRILHQRKDADRNL